jgi:hypothetical protein
MRKRTASGFTPPFARQLVQLSCTSTFYDQHCIVTGSVWPVFAWTLPSRIFSAMLGRIPARQGEIQPAAERDCSVDDNKLLMQSPAERAPPVIPKTHTSMGAPPRSVAGRMLAAPRKQNRCVPDENADFQSMPAPRQEVQEFPEPVRHARLPQMQGGSAVEVPADNDDRMAGTQGRPAEGGEIGFTIDQDGGARGAENTVAIETRPQNSARIWGRATWTSSHDFASASCMPNPLRNDELMLFTQRITPLQRQADPESYELLLRSDDKFLERVQQLIHRSRIAPSLINFEITETVGS